ncbi:MAG: hypothetical protein FWE74_05815 [Oscillospiraceae bacterium]|nr:hypothetical protein [Oscillospiraceae bacterium]
MENLQRINLREFLAILHSGFSGLTQSDFMLEIFAALCGEENPSIMDYTADDEENFNKKGSPKLPDGLRNGDDDGYRNQIYKADKLTNPIRRHIRENKNYNTFEAYMDRVSEAMFSIFCEGFKIPVTVEKTEMYRAIFEQFMLFANTNEYSIPNTIPLYLGVQETDAPDEAEQDVSITDEDEQVAKIEDDETPSPIDLLLPAPRLSAEIRIRKKRKFAEVINAKPGDVVDARMQIRNTTGEISKLGVGITLAGGLALIENSASLYSSYYDGNLLGDIITRTTNIGVYAKYSFIRKTGWAEIVFRIKVDDNVPIGKRLEILNAVSAYDKSNHLASETAIRKTYIRIVKND